ncbi:cytochrome P450 [Musa troglodytarum]|uniref:Cytochrome P450 n=1 Tax=Musa troglodytarum TaxID=320322 RepID=A0A9E7HYI9_9LILI|nr:cytochrome P450 [Musa troglodytarum]
MDTSLVLWAASVTLLATVIITRTWGMKRSGQRGHRLPAGCRGWPLVGETLQFVSCAYSPRPERFMDKRTLMYGKVFRSHLFGSPTIVSTDAEVSRCILQSDARTFVPWYPKSLTELMGKSSILLINGNLQRRVHGLIGAFFKSSDLKAQITRDMQSYVQESMINWQDDQLIRIQDETKKVCVLFNLSSSPPPPPSLFPRTRAHPWRHMRGLRMATVDNLPNTSQRVDRIGAGKGDAVVEAAIQRIYCWVDVFAGEAARE